MGDPVPDLHHILLDAENAEWLLVLAHGAGAGMRHSFLEQLAAALAERKISTFRYQFPYMQEGRRRPDPPPVLLRSIEWAVSAASSLRPDLPVIAGGKSMGGRMTTVAAAQGRLAPAVRGIVLYGFPLHPAGKPSVDRARHLPSVPCPMLFVQGGRDRLAELSLLRPLLEPLGLKASLCVLPEADHSFAVPARSGLQRQDVFRLLAEWTCRWCAGLEA
ncbi:MAG: alpha/beta hydrolase [Acidobacteriota bacterium]